MATMITSAAPIHVAMLSSRMITWLNDNWPIVTPQPAGVVAGGLSPYHNAA